MPHIVLGPFMKASNFIDRHSENFAGGLSALGSTVLLSNSFDIDWNAAADNILNTNIIKAVPENFVGIQAMATNITDSVVTSYNGDPTNLIAVPMFYAAEAALLTKGHTSAGYSFGMGSLAAGDIVLVFSEAVQSNPTMEMALIATAGCLTVGALKYPLEKVSEHLTGSAKEIAQRASEIAPKICGWGSFASRAPKIAAAAIASPLNAPLLIATSCWAASDILAGRLQDNLRQAAKYINNKWNDFREDNTPHHG